MKIHEDSQGNKSSKRIYGGALILQGCVMKWWIFIVGLQQAEVGLINASLSMEASDTLIFAGSALLGIGVLDGIGKLINSKIRNNVK